MISDADLRYVGADCRHDPSDLVTKHRRRRNKIVGGKEQVSVTQPRRSYVYENFVPNGRGDVHILDVEPASKDSGSSIVLAMPCELSSRQLFHKSMNVRNLDEVGSPTCPSRLLATRARPPLAR